MTLSAKCEETFVRYLLSSVGKRLLFTRLTAVHVFHAQCYLSCRQLIYEPNLYRIEASNHRVRVRVLDIVICDTVHVRVPCIAKSLFVDYTKTENRTNFCSTYPVHVEQAKQLRRFHFNKILTCSVHSHPRLVCLYHCIIIGCTRDDSQQTSMADWLVESDVSTRAWRLSVRLCEEILKFEDHPRGSIVPLCSVYPLSPFSISSFHGCFDLRHKSTLSSYLNFNRKTKQPPFKIRFPPPQMTILI